MDKRFKNARLKIIRANSHIDTLIRDSSPLAVDLYEISNAPGYSSAVLLKSDCFNLTFKAKEPLAEYFEPIIGDAVNNLREALDYWLNAAIACVGPLKRLNFPFTSELKDLKTSGNYVAVEKAFPELAEFILKHIKPCRDTNLDLWAANSLCNDNKHNPEFVPTVTIANVNKLNAFTGRNQITNCSFSGNADMPITIIRSDLPITVEQNYSVAVAITFPDGAVFENQPVILTLQNMSQVVSKTLDALDRFVRPYVL